MTTHQSQMWLDYFPSSITQFENQWTFGLKILVYFGGSANSHIQPPDHLTWPTTVAFCRTSGGWSFRWTADFGSKTGRVTKINWSSKSASSGHVTPNLGSRLTRRLKRFKRIVKKTPQGWKVFFLKEHALNHKGRELIDPGQLALGPEHGLFGRWFSFWEDNFSETMWNCGGATIWWYAVCNYRFQYIMDWKWLDNGPHVQICPTPT